MKRSTHFTTSLIHIPIIHTLPEMGALGDSIQQASLDKMGRTALKRKADTIERMWTNIEQIVGALNLNYESVRLYQDGLPICGREVEIVRDLADKGSRNHRLLLRLMEKGAVLMGTESSELIVEEYERYKRMPANRKFSRTSEVKTRKKAPGDSLLKKRDRFIAERINSTLQQGETGILFLGMLHSVEQFLKKEIRVIYPAGRPGR